MKKELRRYAGNQGGYTLVELIVASAVGVLVMTGLTSVIMTASRSGTVATSRVEASAQVRNFVFDANADFALSQTPVINSCSPGDPPPCTITLTGLQASDSQPPLQTSYTVTYRWDGSNVDRQIGSTTVHAATNVSAFSAVLTGAAPHQTVLVTLTVTVQSYSETQALRFYPQVNP